MGASHAPPLTFPPVEWKTGGFNETSNKLRVARQRTTGPVGLQQGRISREGQEDVAKAQSKAADENAKADEKVKQVEAEAPKDRADALAKVADKSVDAIADSAVTQAEGETEIALAKCQSLEGDAQKACKDEANAHLDDVRAKAKAAKSE